MVFFGARASVGIDLGSYGIKWAAADRRRGVCNLWSQVLLPERKGKEEVLTGEALVKRLQKLMAECKAVVPVWSRKVATAVQSGCLGGYMELPVLSAKELKTAVPAAARRRIPYGLDEVFLHYSSFSPLSGQSDKVGVFFLAVQRGVIGSCRELLSAVGLEVKQVDLAPLALAREFIYNRKPAEDEINALLHVGFRSTLMVVLKGGDPFYYRSFTPAAGDLVYAFQMGAQVPWDEAFLRLETYDATTREVAVEPVLRRWLREIRRSLHSVETLIDGVVLLPGCFFLSGGGVVSGLHKRLTEEIGIESVVDGWERLRPSGGGGAGTGHLYKIALGLALA